MNIRFFLLIVFAAGLLILPAAHAVESVHLVNFVMADGGTNDALGSEALYGFAIEDDTAYCQLSLNNLPQITRVDNVAGGQVTTRLVSPAQWLAASGQTSLSTYHGFGVWSNWLQFGDVSSDQIWRVNKITGEIIKYADTTAITNVTGATNGVSVLVSQTINPFTGEHVFYDSRGKHILTTAGSNVVEIFISEQQLSNAFGNAGVSGGMAFDAQGNFYFAGYVSGSYLGIHKRDTNGLLSVFLTKAQMNAVHGSDYSVPGDIMYAPDGLLYIRVYRATAGCVLTCDPLASNPVDTLSLFLTAQQLSNSAAQSANMGMMGWYKGGFCWHHFKEGSWRSGIFATVPTNQPALVITGAVEVTEYSSNVPYSCTLLMTNRWGTFFRYDHTTTAEWSIVGTAPEGVSLDGNLLTVGAVPTNELITLQAVTTAGNQGVTNTYNVWLVPEPAAFTVLLLLGLVRRVRSATHV